MMKTHEMREKSSDELQNQINDLKQELFNLRFQHATHQLEDTSKIRQVRRSIARAKTILNEKGL